MLPPQKKLSIPYTTNRKDRIKALAPRIAELHSIDKTKEPSYRIEWGSYDDGIVKYPFAFEVLGIPFANPIEAKTKFIGAVNYSTSPNGIRFECEYHTDSQVDKNVNELLRIDAIQTRSFSIVICKCKNITLIKYRSRIVRNRSFAGVLSLSVVLLITVGGGLNILNSIQSENGAYAYPKERSYGYDRQGGGDHGRYGGGGAESYDLKPGQYAAGAIGSMQSAHENTLPIWIVSGHWKASMTEKEGVYQKQNASEMTNATSNLTTANMNPNAAKFSASLNMVMINGSAMHNHKIYNFTLNEMSMPDNETMILNGTSTVTLRDGPVHEVTTLITVMAGNTISIYPEPSAVNNHFGPTPIYGTVSKAIHVIR